VPFLRSQQRLAALTDNGMGSLLLSRLRFALARRGDDATMRRFRVKYQRLRTLVEASATADACQE
jgi:hypothetical protein